MGLIVPADVWPQDQRAIPASSGTGERRGQAPTTDQGSEPQTDDRGSTDALEVVFLVVTCHAPKRPPTQLPLRGAWRAARGSVASGVYSDTTKSHSHTISRLVYRARRWCACSNHLQTVTMARMKGFEPSEAALWAWSAVGPAHWRVGSLSYRRSIRCGLRFVCELELLVTPTYSRSSKTPALEQLQFPGTYVQYPGL